MNTTRVRAAMAETCKSLWTSQLEQGSLPDDVELTPVETQALIFAVIDGRAGVDVAEEEVERVLEAATEAKRVWQRLQTAMLGQANLRFDGRKLQVVTDSSESELGGQRISIEKPHPRLATAIN